METIERRRAVAASASLAVAAGLAGDDAAGLAGDDTVVLHNSKPLPTQLVQAGAVKSSSLDASRHRQTLNTYGAPVPGSSTICEKPQNVPDHPIRLSDCEMMISIGDLCFDVGRHGGKSLNCPLR